jgi:hypothetical protein
MGRASDGNSRSLLILAAALATVGLGIALVLGWEPGLRGEWVWRRNALPARLWAPLGIGLALVLLSAALCCGRRWEAGRPFHRAAWMAALILLVFAFQVSLLNAVGPAWVTPGAYILSPNATTYFGVSLEVSNAAEWVADYAAALPALPYHAATHPPGFVLFFLAIRRATAAVIGPPSPQLAELAQSYSDLFGLGLAPADAAAAVVSALAIALIGALGLLPLYFLSCRLAGPRMAICAACLAGSMPGLLLLSASPDLVVCTLAIATLSTAYAAWRGKTIWIGLLAGALAGIGLFFSLAFGLVVAWLVMWAFVGVCRAAHAGRYFRRVLLWGMAAAAGLVILYLGLAVLLGYRPIEVAKQALSMHRTIAATESVRTYWKWVLLNPLECAIFAGLPLTVAALWSWRALGDERLARLRTFVVSWLAILVLLDLSGTVRGEVGRIWLFLLWPASLATAAWSTSRAGREYVVPLLVLLQVVQALLMKGYLTVYSIL